MGVPRRTLRSIHFYTWAEWRREFVPSSGEDILGMMTQQAGGGWVEAGRIAVGDSVIGGSPIGVANRGSAPVMIELRRDGEPVNPLQFVR